MFSSNNELSPRTNIFMYSLDLCILLYSCIDETYVDWLSQSSVVSAKEKLAQLAKEGINTIYLLPITPVGKLKALGTAGSLYAMDDFSTINSLCPSLKFCLIP